MLNLGGPMRFEDNWQEEGGIEVSRHTDVLDCHEERLRGIVTLTALLRLHFYVYFQKQFSNHSTYPIVTSWYTDESDFGNDYARLLPSTVAWLACVGMESNCDNLGLLL
jgi:hypothetical protein